MAYQKLQTERAYSVILNGANQVPIPDPALEYASGVAEAYTGPVLTPNNPMQDNDATFITSNVKVGDFIINTTAGAEAITKVREVISETVLNLDDNIFSATQNYIIYRQSEKSACVLYVGGAGDVSVRTIGGDEVVFKAVPAGTFIPVQVTHVGLSGHTATDIIALR